MKVAKVLGTVVSSEKHPDFDGLKLLVVQPLDENMEPEGQSFIATDRVQAGVGDTVLVMREGGGIRMLFNRAPKFAIRSLIVGIVDDVEVTGSIISSSSADAGKPKSGAAAAAKKSVRRKGARK